MGWRKPDWTQARCGVGGHGWKADGDRLVEGRETRKDAPSAR